MKGSDVVGLVSASVAVTTLVLPYFTQTSAQHQLERIKLLQEVRKEQEDLYLRELISRHIERKTYRYFAYVRSQERQGLYMLYFYFTSTVGFLTWHMHFRQGEKGLVLDFVLLGIMAILSSMIFRQMFRYLDHQAIAARKLYQDGQKRHHGRRQLPAREPLFEAYVTQSDQFRTLLRWGRRPKEPPKESS